MNPALPVGSTAGAATATLGAAGASRVAATTTTHPARHTRPILQVLGMDTRERSLGDGPVTYPGSGLSP